MTGVETDVIIQAALQQGPQTVAIPYGSTQKFIDLMRDDLHQAALRQTQPIEILTIFKDGLPKFVVRKFS